MIRHELMVKFKWKPIILTDITTSYLKVLAQYPHTSYASNNTHFLRYLLLYISICGQKCHLYEFS